MTKPRRPAPAPSSTTKPAPFVIDGPGEYVNRRNERVWIEANTTGVYTGSHPWMQRGCPLTFTDAGTWAAIGSPWNPVDIIAKAPAPQAQELARPVAAWPAKRTKRYVALIGANPGRWWVARKDASGFMRSVAAGMSQPLARRVAAMLNGEGK
jgi:hypothetical protein